MRTLLIAAVVAAPALVNADPLAVQTTLVPAEDAPRVYVQPGLALGSVGGHTMAGATLEVGARITDHLVVHGEGLTGTTQFLLGDGGPVSAATVGLDVTSCSQLQRVCMYGGLALGYGSTKYTKSDWFDSSNAMTTSSEGTLGVIRAGLDIGSKHLRWRPGFEASLFGPSMGALTSSVALAF